MTEGCVFCDHDKLREADLYFENEFCFYASTRDPRDPPDVIPGCGGIFPKVHRTSPFELTAEEWAATRDLLLLVRAELHKRLAPDGYTLGWNDQDGLHPHLHVIPRFDDEPMADQGVRSGIKDPANRRPDPVASRHRETYGRIMNQAAVASPPRRNRSRCLTCPETDGRPLGRYSGQVRDETSRAWQQDMTSADCPVDSKTSDGLSCRCAGLSISLDPSSFSANRFCLRKAF
jgi:histidine triad (HIT) family protein